MDIMAQTKQADCDTEVDWRNYEASQGKPKSDFLCALE